MSFTQIGTAVVVGTLPATNPFKGKIGIGVNIVRTQERIETLDLDPIKIKLMDSEEGEAWSRRQVDAADLMYRRFLFLSAKYPSQSIVPNKIVDTFWHAHILDTRKYAEDCERIFGYFLHHFPYFGMRGEQDARELDRAFEESNRLYTVEFGQRVALVMVEFSSPAKCKPAKCEPPDPWNPANCEWDIRAARAVRPTLQEITPRVCLFETSFTGGVDATT